MPYFRKLPLGEKRAFYAKSLKFMLESGRWDDTMPEPTWDDHQNMRDMLLAFNDQSRTVMHAKLSQDIVLQWQAVRYIRRGTKRRTRKKQVSRLTHEFMQLIRLCHSVASNGNAPFRGRVRCMPKFQRRFKQQFLSPT
jgi:hypothetical protein